MARERSGGREGGAHAGRLPAGASSVVSTSPASRPQHSGGLLSLLAAPCWVAAFVIGLSGCGPASDGPGAVLLRPIHRFVDPGYLTDVPAPPVPAARAWSAASLATATILDDTRYVLSAPSVEHVAHLTKKPLPPEGPLSLELELRGSVAPELSRASRIVVLPEVKHGDTSSKLPQLLVSTGREPERTVVRLELPVPPELSGSTVDLLLRGMAVAPSGTQALTSRPVDLPQGSVLDVSLGILEPAWDQGPVRFTVLACESECQAIHSEVVDPGDAGQRRWHDRRISLEPLSGSRRRLRFETKPVASVDGFSMAAWGNPTILAPSPRAASDVNLILVSIDTLRADRLPTFGYEHDTAPFLDGQARLGTAFDRCVAHSPSTTSSHMTLFTSLYYSTHKTGGLAKLATDIPTLPQYLRAAGIETGAVTEDGWIAIQHGFGRGFNGYLENRKAEYAEGQIDQTLAAARRWLRWHGRKRFFLFIHTYQVHNPFTPDGRYKHLFSTRGGEVVDDRSALHLRQSADYDREIRQTDDALRAFVHDVEGMGLAKDTIFVLTSDHGEEFLEHGQLGHGANLYEEVTHVPLLLWGPGIPGGRRVSQPAGLVDLAPTILDAFQLPAPGWMEGTSLLDVIGDRSRESELGSRPILSESVATYAVTEGGRRVPASPPFYTVHRGSRKLLRFRTAEGYRYELYDLDADPRETTSRYGENPVDDASLVALIDGFEEHCQTARKAIDATAGRPRESQPAVLSSEQEEKLRTLGYIQ